MAKLHRTNARSESKFPSRGAKVGEDFARTRWPVPSLTRSRSNLRCAAMMSAADNLSPARSFQGLILTLQRFWAEQGCVILQPYDMEVGAGDLPSRHDASGAGPEALARRVRAALPPSQGRALRPEPEPAPALLPVPGHPEAEPVESAGALPLVARRDRGRCTAARHPLRRGRLGEPTLGAWGLGWECWCDGMEVSQFTYFQQVAGFECAPVSGELTYGLERLAMYVQGESRTSTT